MPILRVRGLPQRHPELIQAALSKTCHAIAEVAGCKPQHVWATWEELKPGMYVEGSDAAEVQPAETHPPIAELLSFEGRSSEQIAALLVVAAETLSVGLGIPNHIFMTYQEAKSGRVIDGNGIVRS